MEIQKGKEERKKKWENFWYYYKYHVLVGVFVLVCIIFFVKDMKEGIEYDYSVGVVGNYMLPEEDRVSMQKWFEEHAEDLNGDGEVHVLIADYCLPKENDAGFDPQMQMANQTKFTVDVQEGTSMIYFLSEDNYKKFMEVFPEEEETVMIQECSGFREIESPASMKDMVVTLRLLDKDSKIGKDREIKKYFEKCEILLDEFVGASE